ncbi:MAG TPA: hypothetical protein VK335_19000, partial [Bryobacteraceae bacterium]|nr:hypothetical protein [Bryobacteraceae bacterium]HXR17618.1 hypothetical protein [Terriglobales bacterium]HZW95652.1 hypothetical protein [Candidatus Eremiobacteraceae bacterium]
RRSLPLAIFRYNPEDIEARVAELERISPFWCMLGGSLGEKRWHPDRPSGEPPAARNNLVDYRTRCEW